jgi:hypothetical protein
MTVRSLKVLSAVAFGLQVLIVFPTTAQVKGESWAGSSPLPLASRLEKTDGLDSALYVSVVEAAVPDPELCPAATKVAYRFSGVSDDGAKGGAERKEATVLHCQNFSSVNVTIKYQVYQWSGAIVAEACVTASPNRSFTFSTQNTTIYFDDVIIAPGGGTDAIFQGAGVVLVDRGLITCSAQVLDPLGYPPTFAVNLPLWGACGYKANEVLESRSATGFQVFTACQSVTARGTFSVEAGANVTFRSGREIVLDNGFQVLDNATFTASLPSFLE